MDIDKPTAAAIIGTMICLAIIFSVMAYTEGKSREAAVKAESELKQKVMVEWIKANPGKPIRWSN